MERATASMSKQNNPRDGASPLPTSRAGIRRHANARRGARRGRASVSVVVLKVGVLQRCCGTLSRACARRRLARCAAHRVSTKSQACLNAVSTALGRSKYSCTSGLRVWRMAGHPSARWISSCRWARVRLSGAVPGERQGPRVAARLGTTNGCDVAACSAVSCGAGTRPRDEENKSHVRPGCVYGAVGRSSAAR